MTTKAARAHSRNKLQQEPDRDCPVEMTVEVIGGRWKCQIIHHLLEGTKRFSELHRGIPTVSKRMLTKHLRELEQDGIVHRKVFAQVPPRTEYSLTVMGKSLEPLMWSMHDWAVEHLGAQPKI